MKETLRAICDGGLVSRGDIAEKVGVQESILEDILSLLSSKGYLKGIDYTGEMPSGCMGCARGQAPSSLAGSLGLIADNLEDNSVRLSRADGFLIASTNGSTASLFSMHSAK